MLGGILFGYVMYDVTHYYLHHGQPKEPTFKHLKVKSFPYKNKKNLFLSHSNLFLWISDWVLVYTLYRNTTWIITSESRTKDMGSLPLSGIESLEHFPVQRLLRRSSKPEISFCLSLSVLKNSLLDSSCDSNDCFNWCCIRSITIFWTYLVVCVPVLWCGHRKLKSYWFIFYSIWSLNQLLLGTYLLWKKIHNNTGLVFWEIKTEEGYSVRSWRSSLDQSSL